MAEQIYDQTQEPEVVLVPEEVIPVEIVRPEWGALDTVVWLLMHAVEGFAFGAMVMALSRVVSFGPDLGYWESVALIVIFRILSPVDTSAHLRWSRKFRWIDPKERGR